MLSIYLYLFIIFSGKTFILSFFYYMIALRGPEEDSCWRMELLHLQDHISLFIWLIFS